MIMKPIKVELPDKEAVFRIDRRVATMDIVYDELEKHTRLFSSRIFFFKKLYVADTAKRETFRSSDLATGRTERPEFSSWKWQLRCTES